MSRNDERSKIALTDAELEAETSTAPPSARLVELTDSEIISRRRVLTSGAATLAASAAASSLGRDEQAADVPGASRPREGSAAATGARHAAQGWLPPAQPGRDYQPVVVPNGAKLPWKVVDGVKVFHMVAEEVEHEFAPGLKAICWGYNGSVHGPMIEAVDGDRVRIYVSNRLPAATSVHWHSILLPNGMDGVGGLNQKAIAP